MGKFFIDSNRLEKIAVPKVQLTSISKNVAINEHTLGCGCGGTCLSTTT